MMPTDHACRFSRLYRSNGAQDSPHLIGTTAPDFPPLDHSSPPRDCEQKEHARDHNKPSHGAWGFTTQSMRYYTCRSGANITIRDIFQRFYNRRGGALERERESQRVRNPDTARKSVFFCPFFLAFPQHGCFEAQQAPSFRFPHDLGRHLAKPRAKPWVCRPGPGPNCPFSWIISSVDDKAHFG